MLPCLHLNIKFISCSILLFNPLLEASLLKKRKNVNVMLEWCDYAIHRITNVLVVDKHMRRYVVSQGKVDFLIISCWSARATAIIF